MNFFKKLYNTDVADAGGGVVNIAEAMAKQGYKAGGEFGESNRPPIQIKEEPKTETTEVETSAAKASVETKVEEVKETPKPVETVVAETKPTEVKEAAPTPTWQEVLKHQQPDTVLKELGLDDKKVSFINEIKDVDDKVIGIIQAHKNGTLGDYIRELATDYTKMSAEDVMRHNLRQEYPKASEKAIEALFKKEVIDAYRLDYEKYSDEEVEEGRLLLDAKADKYRDSLVEKQKQFLLPPTPEVKPNVVDDSAQKAASQEFEDYKANVSNDVYTKSLLSSNKLEIGEGDEKFSFPINAKAIQDVLFDSNKWAETQFEQSDSGYKPKVNHQWLTAAVAVHGMDFINALANHFKTIGGKKVIDPIDNAKPTQEQTGSNTAVKPDNPAAAMAKHGSLRN